MAIFDLHVSAQGILYFLMCLAGLVISITVGVNRSNFDGVCMLYPKVEWTDSKSFLVQESEPSNCNFPIYFSVFGLIVYGLMMGLYYIYAVCRSRTDTSIGSQMWVMPFLLVNVVICFVTLIVACILSVGFKQFCDSLTEIAKYKKCSDGETKLWRNHKTGETYTPGPYTAFMSTSMVTAWLCLIVELLQIGLGILRFVRNRRQRGMAGDKSTSDTKKIGNVEPTA